VLVTLGGFIAWFLAIPIYMLATGFPMDSLANADMKTVYKAAGGIWDTQIRYMGAGAMVVGGLWSIWCMRRGIFSALGEIGKSFQKGARSIKVKRTEKNLPMKVVLPILALIVLGIFFLYWDITGVLSTALVCAIVMVIAGFLFVAVSSYIVGLVGSTNNPVSGMTIFTLFFASLLLITFGIEGSAGILAALIVAGVVCCAACAAGDMSQDLKTGYLVGATPRNQQLGQIIGVVVAAFITTPVLIILHETTIGGIGSKDLPAPQAKMFEGITKALFGGNVPWAMLIAGAAVAVVLIVLDEIARTRKFPFRLYVMPVAVGIYLPITLAVPILIGGIIRAVFSRKNSGDTDRGILVSSGLIAGEALTGIIVAAIVFLSGKKMPNILYKIFAPETEDTERLAKAAGAASTVSSILGIAAFIAVIYIIAKIAKSTKKSKI
jgi:putative OPT family oligopeptide transporter